MVVMLAGALIGAGVMAGWLALRPQPARPVPREFADDSLYADSEWLARLGRPLARKLVVLGLPRAPVRRDLVVLDRVPEVHLATQATTTLVGLLLPLLLQSVTSSGVVYGAATR